jgi:hypothetical protein
MRGVVKIVVKNHPVQRRAKGFTTIYTTIFSAWVAAAPADGPAASAARRSRAAGR